MASSPTSIFSTLSTPASQSNNIAYFVLVITAAIFVVVSALLFYAMWKFRAKGTDTHEPPHIFGSTQIELSWTIIPILIVVVLFLSTARVLFVCRMRRSRRMHSMSQRLGTDSGGSITIRSTGLRQQQNCIFLW